MNRYLEKIAEIEKEALNALKARAMAHEAGVVVDPDTQWKWALRQFRGKRGELLQGRDRSKVLDRLMGNPAAGNNNFRQAIQSEQRKLTPRDEVQLHRVSASKKPLISKKIPEVKENVVMNLNTEEYRPLINHRLDTATDTHVHPRYTPVLSTRDSNKRRAPPMTIYREVDFREQGGPHRLASPSGTYYSTSPGSAMSTELGWTIPNREAKVQVSPHGDLGVYSEIKTTAGKPANIMTTPLEDGRTFMGNHRVIPAGLRGPVKPRELSKERGFKGVRSSYLDLTPRKARPDNPYLDKLHQMGKTL